MRCPNCSTEIVNGLQVCPACGQRLMVGASPEGTYEELTGQESEVPSFGPPALTSQGDSYPQGYAPAPGQSPPFSPSYPGNVDMPPPPAPGTYAPPLGPLSAPVPKRPPWLVVGLVSLVALLLVAGSGVAYVLHQQAGSTTPTVSPSSVTAILSDPLTANVNGWTVNSHCQFGTDGYHIIGNQTCFAPVGNLTDATVQVQAELLKGSMGVGYGIALRRMSNDSEYFFLVSGRGIWSFQELENYNFLYLVKWTANAAILGGLNRPNLLKVTMHGSQFDFYVNGVQVGSASDTTYRDGLVGLSSSGYGLAGGTSDVVFTHLLITV